MQVQAAGRVPKHLIASSFVFRCIKCRYILHDIVQGKPEITWKEGLRFVSRFIYLFIHLEKLGESERYQ